jgi:hypothetical protein
MSLKTNNVSFTGAKSPKRIFKLLIRAFFDHAIFINVDLCTEINVNKQHWDQHNLSFSIYACFAVITAKQKQHMLHTRVSAPFVLQRHGAWHSKLTLAPLTVLVRLWRILKFTLQKHSSLVWLQHYMFRSYWPSSRVQVAEEAAGPFSYC